MSTGFQKRRDIKTVTDCSSTLFIPACLSYGPTSFHWVSVLCCTALTDGKRHHLSLITDTNDVSVSVKRHDQTASAMSWFGAAFSLESTCSISSCYYALALGRPNMTATRLRAFRAEGNFWLCDKVKLLGWLVATEPSLNRKYSVARLFKLWSRSVPEQTESRISLDPCY